MRVVEHRLGVTVDDDLPEVAGDDAVGDAVMSGMSCSITRMLAPVISRMRTRSGPSASVSRWAMPDDGSSNRITLGSIPIWQARSTMRRLPVERSDTNLSR